MSKHLWALCHPLASSSWAVWARANLLRGRSLWDISIPSSSSWTWKKILQIRPIFCPLIKHYIGDGQLTSLWFDNWLPSGPIHQTMGDRVIYDAGLPRYVTVASIIQGTRWQWPMANSTELLALKEETLLLPYSPSGEPDRIFWLPSPSGLFSIRSAWEYYRQAKPQVPWWRIVWFSGFLPKASFILWLAVKCRLGTQDRLHQLPPNTKCLFCNRQLESHGHLFFECPYSRQVWYHISLKGRFSTPRIPWEQLISWLSIHWRGNSLHLKINLLCFSITIYMLWRERNSRFHSHSFIPTQDLISSIVENVRLKLSTFRGIQDTSQNRILQLGWNLPDSIFSL